MKDSKDEWCTDSGATRNITSHLEILHDIRTLDQPVRIFLAEQNIIMTAYKVGTVHLKTKFGMLVLQDVLYIKNAAQNLLGLKPLIRKGASVNFTPHGVYVWSPNGELIAHAPEKINENQWILGDVEAILPDRFHANSALPKSQLMSLTHRRFGHPGRDRLQQAVNKYQIKNLGTIRVHSCQGCDLSKSHREPFSDEPVSEALEIMQYIHSDVWGPARIATFGGMKWVLTFVDGKSRMSWVFLCETKSAYELFKYFEHFKAHYEKLTGKSICFLRVDNGKEYLGPFKNRLLMWGIKTQLTNDYTPEQNGIAERLNKMLLETTRALLLDEDGMDARLWGEAIMTANYLRNRLPSRGLGWKTPYEVFHGKPASINHLRV